MGKYNTHINKWISWDNINELSSSLDSLKKDVLDEVVKNGLADVKPKKSKKVAKDE